MNKELKLCPFCGEKIDIVVHLNSKGDEFEELVHPFSRKSHCPLRLSVFLREHWQNRPLEDALQRKLDIAVEALRFISNTTPSQNGDRISMLANHAHEALKQL